MSVEFMVGDSRTVLALLPDESMHCCVTSPPYFGLRDYGVDGQIGLEQTPQAYVDELVAVFREVKRVLRDDGTLWLNLGDSYNAHPGQRKTTDAVGPKQMSNRGSPGAPSRHVSELKPKDLIGIPWRVAFALQQPWYAGRIKDERDRIWLAAMIDGEGCFYVHKRGAGLHAGDGYIRQTDTFSPAVEVANTNLAIIERCLAIAGCGAISRQDKDRRQPLFRWTARSDEARALTREVYPYLVAKQQQARIICGMPNNGTMADAAWQGMKLLHAGSATTADFAAPASLHEPGWYLRQDVIWAKPNPMPESVRDRCTKAHEYVFLLSKSERYFFDAEAIAEPQVSDHTAGNNSHKGASAYGVGAGEHRTKAGLVAFAQRSRLQAKRAAELAEKAGLTDEHIAAIRAVGITDTGKARVTQDGTGRNDPKVQALADEAKAALGGYYREFLISDMRNKRSVWSIPTMPFREAHFATMPPELARICIMAGCPFGGTVLDPFGGAGTTGLVAHRLQRNAVLIDLNEKYMAMARKRIESDAGLFV